MSAKISSSSFFTSLSIFLIGFIPACLLMNIWHELGVFDQYNIFFDSDPNTRIAAISHGWVSQWTIHPIFHIIFSTPIRIIAFLIDKAEIFPLNQEQIRYQIGLYIIPILYGFNIVIIHKLLRLIGLYSHEALAILFLMLVSFSNLIFSGLPDHFVLTSLLFSYHALLIFRAYKEDSPLPIFKIYLVGFFLMGTTVTNIVFFMVLTGLYYYFIQAKARKYYGLGLISFLMLSTNYLIAFIWDSLTNRNIYVSYVDRFFNLEPAVLWKYIYSFPLTVAYSIAPIHPGTIKNLNDADTARFSFQFSFLENSQFLVTSPLLILLIMTMLIFGGAHLYLHYNKFGKLVFFYALAIIIMNWGLHSLWGFEQFLYSQHWMTALAILFSGLFCGNCISRRNSMYLVITLIICSLVNNVMVINNMIEALS